MGESDRAVFIYALTDPGTSEIRYIGKSVRPQERRRNHLNEPPTNCHRSHWIQSLRANGLSPGFLILEEVAVGVAWQEREKYWIAHGRELGWSLTNNTIGGDGVEGLPMETRARMALVWKGRKHRPETLEKLRAARRLRITSDATRRKMSASQRGRKILWSSKIAEAVRKLTPEQENSIRFRLKEGEKVKDLAREFHMHRTSISKVKAGAYR